VRSARGRIALYVLFGVLALAVAVAIGRITAS
jgi:hypothetical protein